MVCRTVVFVLVLFGPLLANAGEPAPVILSVVDSFEVPDNWGGIAYEPASGNLLLSNSSKFISRYSTAGDLIGTTAELPLGVDGIDVLPNGDWVLMARGSQGRIVTYNPETGQVVSSTPFATDTEFEGMAFDSNRGTIFFTQDDGELIEVTLDGLDGPFGECGFETPRCGTPEHGNLGFDPRSNRLIGLGPQLDFMTETGNVINSVPVDESVAQFESRSIAVDDDNRLLYALYPTANSTTVRVFDLAGVPEPSSGCLACIALMALLRYRKGLRR